MTSPPYYDARLAEDLTDRLINRPLAKGVVNLLLNSAVTPNQVTLISFLLGLGAAGCVASGTPGALFLGALLLQTSIVVDCVDGQLARAKGLTSDWGDIFDHTSDDVTLVAMALAVSWAVGQWGLALPAFVVLVCLTACQYYYTAEYASFVGKGAHEKTRADRRKVLAMARARPCAPAHTVSKGLLYYYVFRLWFIERLALTFNPWRTHGAFQNPSASHRPSYHARQQRALRCWNCGGVSTVAFVFVLFCLARALNALFATLIVAGGLWLLFCLALQWRTDIQYREEHE